MKNNKGIMAIIAIIVIIVLFNKMQAQTVVYDQSMTEYISSGVIGYESGSGNGNNMFAVFDSPIQLKLNHYASSTEISDYNLVKANWKNSCNTYVHELSNKYMAAPCIIANNINMESISPSASSALDLPSMPLSASSLFGDFDFTIIDKLIFDKNIPASEVPADVKYLADKYNEYCPKVYSYVLNNIHYNGYDTTLNEFCNIHPTVESNTMNGKTVYQLRFNPNTYLDDVNIYWYTLGSDGVLVIQEAGSNLLNTVTKNLTSQSEFAQYYFYINEYQNKNGGSALTNSAEVNKAITGVIKQKTSTDFFSTCVYDADKNKEGCTVTMLWVIVGIGALFLFMLLK